MDRHTEAKQGRHSVQLFNPLDPMLAVALDFPCKRVCAVEPEMRDRDDMHFLAVAETKVEMAHDAAFVAQVPDLSDTAFGRKVLL